MKFGAFIKDLWKLIVATGKWIGKYWKEYTIFELVLILLTSHGLGFIDLGEIFKKIGGKIKKVFSK